MPHMAVQACETILKLSHFESLCLLNEWTEKEKGLYLALSLRGFAQGVLGIQPRNDRQNNAQLVKALQDRFVRLCQTDSTGLSLEEDDRDHQRVSGGGPGDKEVDEPSPSYGS